MQSDHTVATKQCLEGV